MSFVDTSISIKGKDRFAGQKESVNVSIRQFDTLPEVTQDLGSEDAIVALVNEFYRYRAPASFRSAVTNKQKTADNWDSLMVFAREQAPTVSDYQYTGERGLSRKAKLDMLDAMKEVKLETLTHEELLAKLASLIG